MKKYLWIVGLTVSLAACKKDNTDPACASTAATMRQISNRPATVRFQSGEYFLVEQITIDTRLKPCNLPENFQSDGLAVVISGDVKETDLSNQTICCTEDFVISEITQ